MIKNRFFYVHWALLSVLLCITRSYSAEPTNQDASVTAPKRSFTAHQKHRQQTAVKKKKWTILIYIQACNNLESFAHKNLKCMMNTGSTDDVNILVELHKSGDRSWRYRIEKNDCVVDEVVARSPKANVGQEVIDSMRWAASDRYKAEKYALIFWNHGIGVIDPSWSVIEPYYMKQAGIWRGVDVNDAQAVSRATTKKIAQERGILFDDDRRNYLTNPNLRTVLRTISTEVLGGQKLEVVGMDACLMGMLEIPYQFKEYANHFVASQEFEFAQGWSYGPLMQQVAANPSMDGKQFCKVVVDTFHDYYSRKTNYYTQSALNVSRLETLKDNVNGIALLLMACLRAPQDGRRMKQMIDQARCQCLSFSVPDYVDLHSFYDELHRLVTQTLSTQTPPIYDANLLKQLQTLRGMLEVGRSLITGTEKGPSRQEGIVTSNTTGKYLARAKGVSIYFPQKMIDESYAKTEFAKDSAWFDFLLAHTAKK